ncbi:hypothetical protein [Actinacidiphila sp. ITFR-21]|uniref:hypothetical protein n=1 Tax=Actinacidiphila sp. ITFR-21 TaxID=3075199 RepID=UPI00288A1877|nr:hypothetical protein [Streptomyces sp. ITFR-21]WNI19954.1 hypothetical protein RLT57_30905 [Streptomyces sp. ITFR-21]
MRKRSGRPPRFASIPNETIDDAPGLDFMALGLLAVLLRHRDGWEITLARVGARYGYGEDAMAGAMGLLQVAQYVIKVRIMGAGNQWRTEMAVYDTPADDEEVERLLADIRREHPDARRVEVIPPTKAAIDRAAKRRAKLGVSRLGDFPDSGATCENAPTPQVAPDSGVPRDSGDPRVPKKTISKKTKEPEPPPSVPTPEVGARAGTDGGTDGGGSAVVQEEAPGGAEGGIPAAADAAPDRDTNAAAGAAAPSGGWAGATPAHPQATEGLEILRRMGRRVPELALAGRPLRDQALRLDALLAESERLGRPWTPAELVEALSVPFREPIRTSAGAVVSARISALPLTPDVLRIPGQSAADAVGTDDAADRERPGRAAPAAGEPRRDLSSSAAWTWAEKRAALALATRDDRECAGDGGTCRSLAVEGEALCAAHLGWPECVGGCRTRARSGVCVACAASGASLVERGEPTPDGRCPGYGGRECGHPVQSAGWCGRCRIAAQRASDQRLLAEAATGGASATWQQLAGAAAREAEEIAREDGWEV